jgi:hypothetical protein
VLIDLPLPEHTHRGGESDSVVWLGLDLGETVGGAVAVPHDAVLSVHGEVVGEVVGDKGVPPWGGLGLGLQDRLSVVCVRVGRGKAPASGFEA